MAFFPSAATQMPRRQLSIHFHANCFNTQEMLTILVAVAGLAVLRPGLVDCISCSHCQLQLSKPPCFERGSWFLRIASKWAKKGFQRLTKAVKADSCSVWNLIAQTRRVCRQQE